MATIYIYIYKLFPKYFVVFVYVYIFSFCTRFFSLLTFNETSSTNIILGISSKFLYCSTSDELNKAPELVVFRNAL